MFGFFRDIWQAWSKPDFIDRRGQHWIFDYHQMEWFKDDPPHHGPMSETAAKHIQTILEAAGKRHYGPL